MTSDPKETSVTIQDVNRESIEYMRTERFDTRHAIDGDVNGYFFPGWGGGVGLTHTENL